MEKSEKRSKTEAALVVEAVGLGVTIERSREAFLRFSERRWDEAEPGSVGAAVRMMCINARWLGESAAGLLRAMDEEFVFGGPEEDDDPAPQPAPTVEPPKQGKTLDEAFGNMLMDDETVDRDLIAEAKEDHPAVFSALEDWLKTLSVDGLKRTRGTFRTATEEGDVGGQRQRELLEKRTPTNGGSPRALARLLKALDADPLDDLCGLVAALAERDLKEAA